MPEVAAPTEARISRMETRKVITRVDLKRMVTGNACLWTLERQNVVEREERPRERKSNRGKLSLSEEMVSARVVSHVIL
jgi:hypothetical protein